MTKSHLLGSTAPYAPPSEAGAAEAEAPETAAQPIYETEQSSTPAVSRKGRAHAARAPPMQRGAYSVAEFCEAYRLSIPLLYKLWSKGEGPALMKVGVRTLISFEAADKWRRDRERVSAKTVNQTAAEKTGRPP
jgi:hypothetical protein